MPKARLSRARRLEAEKALAIARQSQTTFWDDLHALEEVLGMELSAEDDLAETTIDHLLSNTNREKQL